MVLRKFPQGRIGDQRRLIAAARENGDAVEFADSLF
jgi:hypothetical protein